ncbi:putative isomerase YbhE [Lentithecium fluviatile CBS 122367]|uniref:Putative isomerase YbhE n=1 Tax=Lentithecium fluviatile CBS 122367 TaxID=1168545 RepID=A0A6G1IN14_9PLEO|nr:putative isomerase YbhE [Lentithecium fluviatile CBS 122367]
MALRNLFFAGLATSASAVQILTSAFGNDTVNGSISTFDLTLGVGAASLKPLNAFDKAGAQPTWLDTSLGGGKVVVIDEAWATNASLSTIARQTDGSFKLTNMIGILGSPVAVQFYNNKKALAVAHYGTGAVTTYSLGANGAFTPLEQFKYSNATHGPKPQQADGSHVHHAVIDPTGQYLVFPDLGLDATHVFCIDSKTNKLTPHPDIIAPAGSGPRHAAFQKSGKNTFLYIIHELDSHIRSYKVTYTDKGPQFALVDDVSAFGPESRNTTGSAAAEIIISPDNQFVIGSNRLLPIFTVPNPDPTNSTQIQSDSIVTYKTGADGKLTFVQLAPSGGLNPRHFGLNKDGSLIGIGNGGSVPPSLDIYKRDVKSGKIGEKVASSIATGGGINNVRFLE